MHHAEARGRNTVPMHAACGTPQHTLRQSITTRGGVFTEFCLSCDAVKQCFSCTKKLTKEYFTVPAWKASKPERRLCLHCQKQGKWTCARCHQKLPTLQFSHYNKMRPGGGQNGRQTCNACRAIVVQANVRTRAAKSSIQRLQSVRETLRRRQILRETWEAIADHRKKTQTLREDERKRSHK